MILKRVLPLVLAALAGLLSGMYVRLSFEVVKGRPVSPGGETLLVPLLLLVLYLGYNLGKAAKGAGGARQAFDRGFWEGYRRGTVRRRRNTCRDEGTDRKRYPGL